MDRTGRLSDAAIERTRQRLGEYARQIADLGAQRVRMVATSASRDAANADDFRAMVQATIGHDPEVITGDEEARLSFIGAVRGVGADNPGPYLVVDIGGGSTEFVSGSARVDAAHSVDIGCVRMTERHLRSDPPTPAEIDAATADIDTAIDQALTLVHPAPDATLIGLAGSVTTVALIALGLPDYDPTRIHGSRITYEQVSKVTHDLLAATHAERAAIGGMHPGRIDVIGAGSLILRTIMERTDISSVIASEHDILDGIAWSLVSA